MLKFKRVVYWITTLLACFYNVVAVSQDTLTVMYYNVLNFPGSTPERVDHFRTIITYTRPDVLVITELHGEEGADILLQNGLNAYNMTPFQRASYIDGPDSDNMLFYNSDKLALYSQDTIATALRDISEYVLYPHTDGNVTGTDTIFLRFFAAHLKASQGTDNKEKRLAEVMQFKQHINNIQGAGNIIFGGDLNLYTASEPAYQALINDDLCQLNDPLPAGSWHDNATFAAIHTQSTRTAQFGGGASGGMDDRFDFILFSDDLLTSDNGVTYLANSCYALGNDGNRFNQSLLDQPDNTFVPDSVLQALYYMSDHLPVLCQVAVEEESPMPCYLNLSVFLEGPYQEGEMTPNLASVLPHQQPYDQNPWTYDGTESITAPANSEIVDWILVELRESESDAGNATADHIVWQQACLLLKNGAVVSQDQLNLPVVDIQLPDNVYVAIRHRNHLDIISAYPLEISGDTSTYLFHTAPQQIWGNSSGYSELSQGVWGMTGGDPNADGAISELDLGSLWLSEAGLKGYLGSDFNFDGHSNNRDKNEVLIKNLGKGTALPE